MCALCQIWCLSSLSTLIFDFLGFISDKNPKAIGYNFALETFNLKHMQLMILKHTTHHSFFLTEMLLIVKTKL